MKTLLLSTILLFCGITQAQEWSRSTSTLHGGEIELGAMVDKGSVLDFWVECNYTVYPCLVGPPQDQYRNFFSKVAWKCPKPGNCAHYQLTVLDQNDSFESVMALTEEIVPGAGPSDPRQLAIPKWMRIGDEVDYSVVMTGTLRH